MVRAYLDARDQDDDFFLASDGGDHAPSGPSRDCEGLRWEKDKNTNIDGDGRAGTSDDAATGAASPTDINIIDDATSANEGQCPEAGCCSIPPGHVTHRDGAAASACARAGAETTPHNVTESTTSPSAKGSRQLSTPENVATGIPAVGDASSVVSDSGTAVLDGMCIDGATRVLREAEAEAEPSIFGGGRASDDGSISPINDGGEQTGHSRERRVVAVETAATTATMNSAENGDSASFSCISVSGLRPEVTIPEVSEAGQSYVAS